MDCDLFHCCVVRMQQRLLNVVGMYQLTAGWMNKGMTMITNLYGLLLCVRHCVRLVHAPSPLILSVVLRDGSCYYSQFKDEREKIQRG